MVGIGLGISPFPSLGPVWEIIENVWTDLDGTRDRGDSSKTLLIVNPNYGSIYIYDLFFHFNIFLYLNIIHIFIIKLKY